MLGSARSWSADSPPRLAATGSRRRKRGGGVGRAKSGPVAPNVDDTVTSPSGWRSDVVIRWGDPVTRDAPRFDVDHQTPQSAARQFGYNNDYLGVLPLRGDRALLVANHEYTNEGLMSATGRYDWNTKKEIAIASHGMSVVEIVRGRRTGSWVTAPHRKARRNRRITGETPSRLDGPATGDPRLRTSADPTGRNVLGTLGNCSRGTTPWGTVLSGEQNFNGYFDASGPLDSRYDASYQRYGLTGSGRGWKDVDRRFDLTREPHEPYRFGWIVELDPTDPTSTPRKHTMLGRFKHEGANIALSRKGHAVAYMGDDERGEYIYKFVSRDRFDARRHRSARRRNLRLLSAGTLYVARFTGDGNQDGVHDGPGRWIPLTTDRKSFVAGMSVADVLIDTRLAADEVAPTRMDRPEDIEPNPVNGKVYCALTNNTKRGSDYPTDEANPLANSMVKDTLGGPLRAEKGNRNGYVLELSPARNDHARSSFTRDLMLFCGDRDAPESYFAGYPSSWSARSAAPTT